MKPVDDDGFDSIGVYKKAHLVRMYSINRATGQIVDFMRGCQVFHFKDLENFEQRIRSQSHTTPLHRCTARRQSRLPQAHRRQHPMGQRSLVL